MFESSEAAPGDLNINTDPMTWRVRYLISCFASLPKRFSVGNSTLRLAQIGPSGEPNSAPTSYIVDAELEHLRAREALIAGKDLMEEAADRIAYLSLGPAWIDSVSAVPATVAPGDRFVMAFFQSRFGRTSAEVPRRRFQDLNRSLTDPSMQAAIRSLRLGLSEDDPYRRYLDLWRASEQATEWIAKRDESYVEHRCPKCDQVRRAGPATQPALKRILELLTDHVKDQSTVTGLAKALRDLRGRIAHGARAGNRQLEQEARAHGAELCAAAVTGISEILRVKPCSRSHQHFSVPIHEICWTALRVSGGGFAPSEERTVEMTAQISSIPKSHAEESEFFASLNVATCAMPAHIEIAFPDVESQL